MTRTFTLATKLSKIFLKISKSLISLLIMASCSIKTLKKTKPSSILQPSKSSILKKSSSTYNGMKKPKRPMDLSEIFVLSIVMITDSKMLYKL